MKDTINLFLFVLIYLGFFGLIGYVAWYTHSGWALWALLLFPSLEYKGDKE